MSQAPLSSSANPARQHLAGIALVMAAVICFACIDASAKWLNRSMAPLQIAVIRYLGSFLLVTVLLNPVRNPGIMRSRRLRLQVARAACLVLMSLCIFTALRYLPLTQVTSIAFISPMIVAVLAAPILGETLGPRRIVAVLVGFAGVLVITRPWTGSFQPTLLLPVLTAGLNALYSITTRFLAAHDSPETTMFYTGLVSAIIVLPLAPFVWETPTLPQVWLVIGLLCTFGALGHWMLILSHMRAPASMLAPFFYTHLVWATILGAFVFGERPDRWTIIGAAIVMISGLYLLYRERVRHKRPSVDVPV